MKKKRLLLFTQKMDKTDDLLGVYHEWVRGLAEHFETIQVVCLYEGKHTLPENVEVHSLGKEKGGGTWKYLSRFYRLIFGLRSSYDVVFVHMNPEYLILGGWFWCLTRKPRYFWYAHPSNNLKFYLAHIWITGAVTSVESAYPTKTKKKHVIGQGIDTQRFVPREKEKHPQMRLLFVGRISLVKQVHVLLEALQKLRTLGNDMTLTLVGAPGDHDASYHAEIQQYVQDNELEPYVRFLGKIPNTETPAVYANHDLFISLTKIGFFDKTTLEAMSCATPIVVANAAFEEILPEEYQLMLFQHGKVDDLVRAIECVRDLGDKEQKNYGMTLRKIIEADHNIHQLTTRLARVLHGDS